MALTPVENYIQAVRYGKPEYMPRGDEDIFTYIPLRDNSRNENWTDAWGVTWIQEKADTAPFPTGCPLGTSDRLTDYKFPNPDDLFTDYNTHRQQIADAKAAGKLTMGGYTYFLFERIWALMGMENFFCALIEEPVFVKELLHEIARYVRRVFDNFLELGIDCVSFSEDLGTQRALMISPAHFTAFFLPEYVYIFENVLREKKMINFHSCGCVSSIVPLLAEIGVTILNPIQARANDITQIKAAASGKMALQGGVDSHIILTGTPEAVAKETERVIEMLKPGGGYICTPDQHFPEFPRENLDALYKTATDLGRY